MLWDKSRDVKHLPTTPAFEAAYAVAPDPPFVAMRLETLMMHPTHVS
jgi:hypothetical protein